ncbi:MAG: ArsR/SmtB family transcription factor, partial [Halanaerobiales bacterium]
ADYINENREELMDTFCGSMKEVYAQSSREVYFDNGRDEIRVYIVYFSENGTLFLPEEGLVCFGYRFPEVIPAYYPETEDLMECVPLFKVLADETRLKVLLEINEDFRYLAEIAGDLDISSPAAKYHINKLLRVGLIKVESSGNRIYYRVEKDKISRVVERLKEAFLE